MNSLLQKSYCALIYDELEEYEEAILFLTEHLKKNSWHSIAYNNRGVALSEIGKNEAAAKDFENAIKYSTDNHIPYLNYGDYLKKSEKSKKQ